MAGGGCPRTQTIKGALTGKNPSFIRFQETARLFEVTETIFAATVLTFTGIILDPKFCPGPKLERPYDKMSTSDSLFGPNDCKCELRKFYVDIRSLKDIVTDPSVKRAMDNPIFKSVNIGIFT